MGYIQISIRFKHKYGLKRLEIEFGEALNAPSGIEEQVMQSQEILCIDHSKKPVLHSCISISLSHLPSRANFLFMNHRDIYRSRFRGILKARVYPVHRQRTKLRLSTATTNTPFSSPEST